MLDVLTPGFGKAPNIRVDGFVRVVFLTCVVACYFGDRIVMK